jgi:hypothetical protein
MGGGMARQIAGGFAKQAAIALALGCLLMPAMSAPRAEVTGRAMIEPAGQAPTHWPLLDFLRATAALLVLLKPRNGFLHADIQQCHISCNAWHLCCTAAP